MNENNCSSEDQRVKRGKKRKRVKSWSSWNQLRPTSNEEVVPRDRSVDIKRERETEREKSQDEDQEGDKQEKIDMEMARWRFWMEFILPADTRLPAQPGPAQSAQPARSCRQFPHKFRNKSVAPRLFLHFFSQHLDFKTLWIQIWTDTGGKKSLLTVSEPFLQLVMQGFKWQGKKKLDKSAKNNFFSAKTRFLKTMLAAVPRWKHKLPLKNWSFAT